MFPLGRGLGWIVHRARRSLAAACDTIAVGLDRSRRSGVADQHETSEQTGATDQSGVTVEPFTMDDFPVVHVLWQRSGLWMRPSDGPEQTLLKLARDPGLFLVARDAAGAIVGTVMGGWDGRRAYVYHLAVLPERQRQGIAGRLMDELEARFRKLGALKAKLQILSDNDTSRAFFAARGYLLETDCEPWGRELVEGGAPPTR
jgi:GNAT superfamily N-acetyltransferase